MDIIGRYFSSLLTALVSLPHIIYGSLKDADTWRTLKRLWYILVAMVGATAVGWPIWPLVSFLGGDTKTQELAHQIVTWLLFGVIIWYMKRRGLDR